TIISYGERLSTYIYAKFLLDKKFKAEFISASDNILITNRNFGKALPKLDIIKKTIPERLESTILQDVIPVFSGFYGCTENGEITTLGRGGSDFTATIIAYALAKKYRTTVIFWKDVYGLLSADPKYEPHAKILRHITFSEAKELAFFGSKVLHPLCLITAEKEGVKVELKNFDDPFDVRSTLISKQLPKTMNGIPATVKAITVLEKIAMVTVEGEAMVSLPGAAAELFSIIGKNKININFISQSSSENNITFGIEEKDGLKVGQVLTQSDFFGKSWFNIRVEHDVSLIAVVGIGMAHTPGIAGKVFITLGNAGINVRAIAQGSSEMNISFVIERNDIVKAVRKLHYKFIEAADKTTSFW
ncbi:MAG: aspartate kinase, partial [Promethearchaeota archaeon]